MNDQVVNPKTLESLISALGANVEITPALAEYCNSKCKELKIPEMFYEYEARKFVLADKYCSIPEMVYEYEARKFVLADKYCSILGD